MRAHRAPVFSELYPTRAFYEAARRDYERMHAEPPPPPAKVGRVMGLKLLPRELFPAIGELGADTHIVPEGRGRIRKILITVPKFLNEKNQPLMFRYERYPQHFQRLLKAFGAAVHWVIVSGDRELPLVRQWLEHAGIPDDKDHISHVRSPRFNYSIWAQDPYLALNDGAHILLCEGVSFNRDEDMTIADDVDAQVRGILGTHSYLFFQGGNILGGKDLTLIGADHVVRNTGRFGIEHKVQVLDWFRTLTGTEVLSLGGAKSGHDDWHRTGVLTGRGFQPIFHIDMFVTRTGVRGTSGKEIVFYSRPRAARRAVGKWSEVDYLNTEKLDEFFDETQCQLSDRFEVRELPLLSTRGDLGGNEEFVRYYFLTWGNALVESDEARRRVVLPAFVEHAQEFGLDEAIRRELQDSIESAWRQLGFDVLAIDGMEDLAWGDGSIHCIAKVLERAHHHEMLTPDN